MTRTRVAQVVSLACAHHIPCVILMRSCCVFDSLRLLHFPLFAVYLLSYHPVFPLGHQLHLPRCGGQIPCAHQQMRTLALLPDTTLSHHERDREDPYFSDIREWLQEFTENLVDGRVLERGDSHASSSHGLSLEPTGTADLGTHSVYTHFQTDRNCEICQRTKITRARAEDALAESYLVQKNLVT